MSSRFTEADLRAKNLVWDERTGSYVKINHPLKVTSDATTPISHVMPKASHVAEQPVSELRTIEFGLFGIPMPKQSVRTKNGHFYQPKKFSDRVKDYQKQLAKVLPKDFTPFAEEVHVLQMHFVYPPLKSFHRIKGRMEAIRDGEIFYKNTRPDLPDNLKKLVMDAMSGMVYKDDGLIVSENDVKKYYGTGGAIIIKLAGR